MKNEFWAAQAWVNGQWARDVRLAVADDGTWAEIEPGASAFGRPLGPVLPGVVNAHSHAFQRAIAGLSERSQSGQDDFWSWRDRMYSAALRISPDQLQAIATQLYGELLRGGYTHVCEFHYLHNEVDGKPYADSLEMSMALVRAAQATGIGLTLLPVLYMHSGFGAQRSGSGLRHDQRRFASTPDSVLRIAEGIQALNLPNISAGIALHSLRAVDPAALLDASGTAAQHGWPIHIHIAEQTQEVTDCISHHGQRPIEWLLDHAAVDAHWSLVHATHTTPQELGAVKASGATVVLCPSTEANLGDGVFDLPAHLSLGSALAIGSDSHVSRSLSEEIRLLEYSQRLSLRKRNVAVVSDQTSTAASLFGAAASGGSACAGRALDGLQVGQRADFFTLDDDADALIGVPASHLLDAWVFSSPGADAKQTFVAGQRIAHATSQRDSAFQQAMRALWC